MALDPQAVKLNAIRRAKAYLEEMGMAADDFSSNLLIAHMCIDSLVDAMTEEGERQFLKEHPNG
jgi:hypothetical protein